MMGVWTKSAIYRRYKSMRRLNAFDTSVIVVAVFCALGFGLAKAGHAGVDSVVEGKARIGIDVYLIGLKTTDANLFSVGDKSAITIRNRPVEPPMVITRVEHWPHKASFLAPDGKSAVAFTDPTMMIEATKTPLAHDFLVTVEENAERTKHGYVVSRNKIKIGNQVELEGFKYRAQGVVVEIRDVGSTAATSSETQGGAPLKNAAPAEDSSK